MKKLSNNLFKLCLLLICGVGSAYAYTTVNNGATPNNVISGGMASNGNVYVGTDSGNIWQYVAGNGWSEVNRSRFNSEINFMAFDTTGNVYSATYNGNVYEYGQYNNAQVGLSNASGAGGITTMAVDNNSNVYVGVADGSFYVSNVNDDGWNDGGYGPMPNSGEYPTAIGTQNNGQIFVLSNEGYIYNINPDTEYPMWMALNTAAIGYFTSIVVDGNNNAYAGNTNGNVYVIGQNSYQVLNAGVLPDGSYARAIALDSSNNIYASTTSGNVYTTSVNNDSWMLIGESATLAAVPESLWVSGKNVYITQPNGVYTTPILGNKAWSKL